MDILVSGGLGFVGSHLVERLVSLDHNVFVVDDRSNSTRASEKTVKGMVSEVYYEDISKPLFLKSKIDGFDVVYHLACFPRSMSFDNPERSIAVNVIGTLNMLEVCRRNRAKIILSSNSGIYSTDKVPIDEKTADMPTSPYDVDKLSAENYIKLYNRLYQIRYTIFRFATVYGPRQNLSKDWRPVIMEFMTKALARERPTIYGGEQTRDFIFVSDIVDALVRALEGPVCETMILGTGVETSILELWRKIARLVGVEDLSPVFKPMKVGDIRRMRYSYGKAKSLLGWEPRYALDDGLNVILKYLQNSREK